MSTKTICLHDESTHIEWLPVAYMGDQDRNEPFYFCDNCGQELEPVGDDMSDLYDTEEDV